MAARLGTVVDVYIPNRKSKAGKRFAFVCFIKVENVDRLVGNLYTLWIGRMHLHANVVRFERSLIHSSRPINPIRSDNTGAPSFASALKGNPNISFPISSSPAMVLDDSCVVKRDLDNYVMGEVKQFSSINNLRNFPDNTTSKDLWEVCQGFGTVVDVYIPNRKSKAGKRFAFVRFIKVENVDRLVGNLCTLWIGHMHLYANVFRFERSPIHSSHVAEVVYCSDDESVKGDDENNVETSKQVNLDAESDVEDLIQPLNEKETSNDPFNIYDLLKKHDKGEVNSRLDTSFPYPPGFTPENDNLNIDVHELKGTDQAKSQSRSKGLCLRILEETQSLDEHLSFEFVLTDMNKKRRFYLGGSR
nr:nucleotide-binding alpha-beta plait domain-containing protein [Tanacetum cinerariifolium]